jgi:hypothetical protein
MRTWRPLRAVFAGMMFRRFGRVVDRIDRVPVRYMGMMAGFFVIPIFVVFCGFTVMFRCLVVVLCSAVMMLYAFVFHFG